MKRRWRWRPLLRGLHRDAGYLAVGLTFVYACSGLAVNHIADWDPSFQKFEAERALSRPLDLGPFNPEQTEATPGERAAARRVLAELGVDEAPQDVYRATATQLEIVLSDSTVHVDTARGSALQEGQKPRLLLRLANWLHLNRGKQAWTYVADTYAVFLLFLAVSGVFMLPGRGRFIGRRGALVAVGALVPVLYVVLSGGP